MAVYPTHAFSSNDITIEYGEEHASAALNESLLSQPPGVYEGFTPQTTNGSRVVQLVVNGTTSRSLLRAEDVNGNYSVAVMTKSPISIDFTSHTVFPVYIVARCDYTIGAATTAELITTQTIANGRNTIAICKINESSGNLVATYSSTTDRSTPFATTGKTHGFARGGDIEILDQLNTAPPAHAASHASGGSDPIKLDDLAAPDDNTDLDTSSSAHGLCPKLSGNAGQYLDGTGVFSIPGGNYTIDLTPKTSTFSAVADGRVYLLDMSVSNFPINLPASTSTSDGAVVRLYTLGTGAIKTISGDGTDVIRYQYSTLGSLIIPSENSLFIELVLRKTSVTPAEWLVTNFDTQTPGNHASSHQLGGTDSIKLDDLAPPDDNTDLNATSLKHGLCPKLSGSANQYLSGDGTWTDPLPTGAFSPSYFFGSYSGTTTSNRLHFDDSPTSLGINHATGVFTVAEPGYYAVNFTTAQTASGNGEVHLRSPSAGTTRAFGRSDVSVSGTRPFTINFVVNATIDNNFDLFRVAGTLAATRQTHISIFRIA